MRLSPAEASRPELWNSIIFEIPEAKEYIEFRINFGTTKIKKLKRSDLFLKQSSQVHNLNKISGPWWVVELTRNGKNYQSSKNAFLCTTYFTDRYMTMNLMHYRDCNWYGKLFLQTTTQETAATRRSSRKSSIFGYSNDYLISENIENQFESVEYDISKLQNWQNSKRNPQLLMMALMTLKFQ